MAFDKHPRIIRRTIRVHPPEADAVSRAFAESRSAAEADRADLQKISDSLDAGWEGSQKVRFLEELKLTFNRISDLLLPRLQALEKKYREYLVEKTVEEVSKD